MAALWQLLWWLGVGLVVLGAVAAFVMLRSPSKRWASGAETLEMPHRGINVSRIAVAGVPGLVFALGFVWMFWFGAPTYRPVVVVAAVVGAVVGVLLVVWRRRSAGDAMHEVLDLREHNQKGQDHHDQ